LLLRVAALTALGGLQVLGERITDWGESRGSGVVTLTTDQGHRIVADLLYRCVGFKPNTEVAASLLASAGDNETGLQKTMQGISVTETMQASVSL
jgi:hypothetical protein